MRIFQNVNQIMMNLVWKKSGRKPMIGGLPTDTFLSLSRALRTHSTVFRNSLKEKIKHVLSGVINDDTIENISLCLDA